MADAGTAGTGTTVARPATAAFPSSRQLPYHHGPPRRYGTAQNRRCGIPPVPGGGQQSYDRQGTRGRSGPPSLNGETCATPHRAPKTRAARFAPGPGARAPQASPPENSGPAPSEPAPPETTALTARANGAPQRHPGLRPAPGKPPRRTTGPSPRAAAPGPAARPRPGTLLPTPPHCTPSHLSRPRPILKRSLSTSPAVRPTMAVGREERRDGPDTATADTARRREHAGPAPVRAAPAPVTTPPAPAAGQHPAPAAPSPRTPDGGRRRTPPRPGGRRTGPPCPEAASSRGGGHLMDGYFCSRWDRGGSPLLPAVPETDQG